MKQQEEFDILYAYNTTLSIH